MRRILFEWHGIKLYAYPVMLYLGLLCGVMAGTYGASFNGLNPVRVYAAMLLLIPSALVGARLLFLMANWRFYRRQPRRLWRQSEGGASLYGGLVLSCLSFSPLAQNLREAPRWSFLGCGERYPAHGDDLHQGGMFFERLLRRAADHGTPGSLSSRSPGRLVPPRADPAPGGWFGRHDLAWLGGTLEPAPLRRRFVPLYRDDLLNGALVARVDPGRHRNHWISEPAPNHLGGLVGGMPDESCTNVAPIALIRWTRAPDNAGIQSILASHETSGGGM